MLHLTLCTLHLALRTLHSTHFTLCTLHSAYFTLHSTLHTPQSPLHTLRHIPPSTRHCLYTPHSALHPIPHSTVFTGTVTGEECTKLLKELVAQKCFTWLHSGSLFARVSFLYLCLVAQMDACNAQPEAAVTESLED